MTEYVYHVDKEDNVIGKVTRKEMREKVLMHRGCVIFVFNSKGELLIHKRTMTKDLFPGYFDIAVGGTRTWGETAEENSIRETEEELGIKDPKLEFVFKGVSDIPQNKSIYHCYRLVHDGPFKPQPEEVEFVKFVSLDELNELLKKEKVCPDTLMIFKKFQKEIKK